jgi:hypothetical protein
VIANACIFPTGLAVAHNQYCLHSTSPAAVLTSFPTARLPLIEVRRLIINNNPDSIRLK